MFIISSNSLQLQVLYAKREQEFAYIRLESQTTNSTKLLNDLVVLGAKLSEYDIHYVEFDLGNKHIYSPTIPIDYLIDEIIKQTNYLEVSKNESTINLLHRRTN